MRKLILLSLLASSTLLAHEERTPAPPTPIAVTAEGRVYGAEWPAKVNALDLDEAAGRVAELKDQPHVFTGRITEVCQKMGCWVVLASESGQLARVMMHEHSYSVPKDASGMASVYGTLSEKSLSTEESGHLVDDGAQAPKSDRELRIDALSVLIRDAG